MGVVFGCLQCDLVKNSRAQRAITVDNCIRGTPVEKLQRISIRIPSDSLRCLETLSSISTAIINLDRFEFPNILSFRMVLLSFQAVKNAGPQF